jgi:NAD(P)-dependent dehydrogenase (short-subunit alcohol dehydrogenase family)
VSAGLLAGRRAVVTGGASGIGAGIVRVLADAGADRGAVLDLREALSRASLPGGWTGVPVDLRDAGFTARAFEAVRESLGTIDVLVAAAGVVPLWTGVESMDLVEWDDVLDVNARGVLCSMREALPAMPDDGAIVVIASQNAWRGSAVLPAYAASKHAVLGLVRSAALELGPRGIRVNAVGPGSVATDAYRSRLARRAAGQGPSVAEALEHDAGRTALRRLATVDEVANGVLFLASRLASGVTGHILPVGAWVT